jgi:hypothetical protein
VNAEPPDRLAVGFARETARASTARLSSACVEVLAVTGVAITIMGSERGGPMCVSDSNVAELEDLQYTVGQGPCRDAFDSGIPVYAPRLDLAWSRWPSFVDLAQARGIGAVFAYPLIAGGSTIGVMAVYQDVEGELTSNQHHDCVGLAAILTETVLSLQDDAPAGTLAIGLDDIVEYRAEIYQASGMVSIQLSISVAEALLRIRAHAYANGQTVAAVAADIVCRRLRLHDDGSIAKERDK